MTRRSPSAVPFCEAESFKAYHSTTGAPPLGTSRWVCAALFLLAASGCRPSAQSGKRSQHLPVMSFEHCGASYIPSATGQDQVFKVSLDLFPSFLRLERVGPYEALGQNTTVWISVEPQVSLPCILAITHLQSGPKSGLVEQRWILPREDVTVDADARVVRSDIGVTWVHYSGDCQNSSVVVGAKNELRGLSLSSPTISGADREEVSLIASQPDGLHPYTIPAGSFVAVSESPCENLRFTIE